MQTQYEVQLKFANCPYLVVRVYAKNTLQALRVALYESQAKGYPNVAPTKAIAKALI